MRLLSVLSCVPSLSLNLLCVESGVHVTGGLAE